MITETALQNILHSFYLHRCLLCHKPHQAQQYGWRQERVKLQKATLPTVALPTHVRLLLVVCKTVWKCAAAVLAKVHLVRMIAGEDGDGNRRRKTVKLTSAEVQTHCRTVQCWQPGSMHWKEDNFKYSSILGKISANNVTADWLCLFACLVSTCFLCVCSVRQFSVFDVSVCVRSCV